MAFSWYSCISCGYDALLSSTGGEGRYFFPANCMLLLALLLAAAQLSPPWLRRVAAATFAWLMLTGAFHYLRMRPVLNDYPAWLPQVRRWQAEEHQPIFIAPRSWTPLHLTRHHPNRTDLPADAYDSLTRHSVRD